MLARIAAMQAEIDRFRGRNSQSNPAAAKELREMRKEMEELKAEHARELALAKKKQEQ